MYILVLTDSLFLILMNATMRTKRVRGRRSNNLSCMVIPTKLLFSHKFKMIEDSFKKNALKIENKFDYFCVYGKNKKLLLEPYKSLYQNCINSTLNHKRIERTDQYNVEFQIKRKLLKSHISFKNIKKSIEKGTKGIITLASVGRYRVRRNSCAAVYFSYSSMEH